MNDIKFFSPCEFCKKRRFIVKRRSISVKQLNQTATSKKLMCKPCKKTIIKALELNNI